MPPLSGKKVIGLTGSMGAGKSTVSAILKEHMPVLDLDAVNRRLLEENGKGTQALSVLEWLPVDHGVIDKPALSLAMFSDPVKKAQVESILHPLLWKEMEAWTQAQTGLCAVEVPLLFETGSQNRFDEVWCVTASEATALDRLWHGRHIDPQEAKRRLASQMSPASKIRRSDVVITNDGDLDQLRTQVESVLERRLCQNKSN